MIGVKNATDSSQVRVCSNQENLSEILESQIIDLILEDTWDHGETLDLQLLRKAYSKAQIDCLQLKTLLECVSIARVPNDTQLNSQLKSGLNSKQRLQESEKENHPFKVDEISMPLAQRKMIESTEHQLRKQIYSTDKSSQASFLRQAPADDTKMPSGFLKVS